MTYRLAVSSYSFDRFGAGPEGKEAPTVFQMIDRCAALGVEGIEILGFHLRDLSERDLLDLKAHAFRRGVEIVSISANHNFVVPDPADREREIDIVARWIDAAHILGAPSVRAFGGRWTTLEWEQFMAAQGHEPPRTGYTDDDGFGWSIEAFKIVCYYAGRKGITVAVENHWGLTGRASGVMRIVDGTQSRWLGVALDTGNFPFVPDMYAEMALLAPRAVMVHAKTYVGGGMYYTVDVDYRRVARLLVDAGYRGYVSIEHEGKALPEEGIATAVANLRSAFANL
ncbi:MAG: sugar phosphate isomerase/epimerase [Chloroflexota bacterium]|nr:MAG: sugar phosphate isomerase/epimerase [Chloroflexota bacterium]